MTITLKELSRLAGVSTASVSVVLNGKEKGQVSPAKARHIRSLAQKHGYRRNPMARALVEGRTYRIAICVEDSLPEPVGGAGHYEQIRMFAEVAQEAGYAIEFYSISSKEPLPELCRQMARKKVDGFSLMGMSAPLLDRLAFSLRENRIPAVCPGSMLSVPECTWTDVDQVKLFERITSRLIEDDRHRLALLYGSHSHDWLAPRREAIEQQLHAHDLGSVPPHVCKAERFSFEGIYRAACQALDGAGGVDGLILVGTAYCEAVLFAMRERGIKVGRDCRLIGVGTAAPLANMEMRLSHYHFQVREQAKYCMAALAQQIQRFDDYQPQPRVFDGEYAPGDT